MRCRLGGRRSQRRGGAPTWQRHIPSWACPERSQTMCRCHKVNQVLAWHIAHSLGKSVQSETHHPWIAICGASSLTTLTTKLTSTWTRHLCFYCLRCGRGRSCIWTTQAATPITEWTLTQSVTEPAKMARYPRHGHVHEQRHG